MLSSRFLMVACSRSTPWTARLPTLRSGAITPGDHTCSAQVAANRVGVFSALSMEAGVSSVFSRTLPNGVGGRLQRGAEGGA
jgi:hypothetical protein